MRHLLVLFLLGAASLAAQPRYTAPLDMSVPPLADDPEVQYDYDIVYVRVPRDVSKLARFAEVSQPRVQQPGGDLVLRRPNGTEEVLVDVDAPKTIVDPMVSPDGQWVYYSLFYDGLSPKGADIFKVNVRSKKVVQITSQEWTPNTPDQPRPAWGIFNTGPAPGPDGMLVFTSDRNGFESTNPGYAKNALAFQLTVLDESTGDVQTLGHLNLGSALHPVWLNDGRIMYSTLESQGIRSPHLWGLWVINPDGTGWAPIMSAFDWGGVVANSFHFQTQISDGRVVVESYYNVNNRGMGPLYVMPLTFPPGEAEFGSAWSRDPRNTPQRHGRRHDGSGIYFRYPFTRVGLQSLTPFVVLDDNQSQPSVLADKNSPRVGKFTHPSGAPDNHLLAVWSPGSVQARDPITPMDTGIYVIKGTRPVDEPAAMRLVVNDPAYHEQWPRAVVPWERIYGAPLPARPPTPWSADIPEGAPWGYTGTSSVYKRETVPRGCVKPGTVTAEPCDPPGSIEDFGMARTFHWVVQGADAGVYTNSEIAAIRILHFEPTPDRHNGRTYYNHAREKIRILGEIPIRKFKADGSQPTDPDGNPDTSFKVAVPADVAWTFDLIDKHGRTLTRAQTWHQVRPGETRVNCGGCHAHSQKPTDFSLTLAAKPDYKPFDLTKQRYPLLTTKANDELGQRWDPEDDIGVRFVSKPESPEWHRDIKPLLVRTGLFAKTTDPNLKGIDPADETKADGYSNTPVSFWLKGVPKGYAQICVDAAGTLHPVKAAHKSGYRNRGMQSAMSRLVRAFQSRRSPLIWALYGQRLDGIDNEAFPYQRIPGDDTSWTWKGTPIAAPTSFHRDFSHIAYLGDGQPAAGFTEDERMMVSRWVDLGCPIELQPGGWHDDTQRPTVVVTPSHGVHEDLNRLTLGLHDINSGLKLDTLSVKASVALDGARRGSQLASKFRALGDGRWVWEFKRPLGTLPAVKLAVRIADNEGNVTERNVTFSTTSGPAVETTAARRLPGR
jgi:hypothetical protein